MSQCVLITLDVYKRQVQGNMQILQNIWIASGSCFAGAGAEYSIRMTLTGRKCGGKVAVRL